MAVPTDQELLDAYRLALLAISQGQSYAIGARSLSRPNLREVRTMIDWLDQRISAAGDSSGGTDLVEFLEPI